MVEEDWHRSDHYSSRPLAENTSVTKRNRCGRIKITKQTQFGESPMTTYRQIESLKTSDDAALWAQRRLGAKSTLHSADAEHVERGFQDRLMSFASDAAVASIQKVERPLHRPGQGKKRSRSATIDKTVLALPAPRRIRDREHVKSVAKRAVSGLRPPSRRCPPFKICAITSTWPQGQRRVHSSSLPRTSPRSASLWR